MKSALIQSTLTCVFIVFNDVILSWLEDLQDCVISDVFIVFNDAILGVG